MERIYDTEAVETPFGALTAEKDGERVSFSVSETLYRFRNGISAPLYRIRLDAGDFVRGDVLCVRIGTLNRLAYYDSDENTFMQAYSDDRFCIAVIGTDTCYDDVHDWFYGERVFAVRVAGTASGVQIEIVRDPLSFDDAASRLTELTVIWLPVSAEYDAAELIDTELV